jgi:hypothetical protein
MRRALPFLLLSLCLPGTAVHALDAPPRAPHGWREGSNLPPPNSWQGSMSDFEPAIWQHGVWRHARHDRRLGWWYTAGMDWFAFEEPVFPYPDMFTPAGYPGGWWYWCGRSAEYYPYVTACAGGWTPVAPKLLSPS